MNHDSGGHLPGTFWEQVSPTQWVSSSSPVPCLLSPPSPAVPNCSWSLRSWQEGSHCPMSREEPVCGRKKATVRASRASLSLSIHLHLWRVGGKHLVAEGSQRWVIHGLGWIPAQRNKQKMLPGAEVVCWPPGGNKNWLPGRETTSWEVLWAITELWRFFFPPLLSCSSNP